MASLQQMSSLPFDHIGGYTVSWPRPQAAREGNAEEKDGGLMMYPHQTSQSQASLPDKTISTMVAVRQAPQNTFSIILTFQYLHNF